MYDNGLQRHRPYLGMVSPCLTSFSRWLPTALLSSPSMVTERSVPKSATSNTQLWSGATVTAHARRLGHSSKRQAGVRKLTIAGHQLCLDAPTFPDQDGELRIGLLQFMIVAKHKVSAEIVPMRSRGNLWAVQA